MKANRIFTAILSIALCVNFISCGDDDDNNFIDPKKATKRLVKIEYSSEPIYGLIEFSYDSEGRMIFVGDKRIDKNYYYNCTIEYLDGKVSIVEDDNNVRHIMNCTLNSDGMISTATDKYGDQHFTYSDGHLIKWRADWGDEEGDGEGFGDYVYENGVMISSGEADKFTYTKIPNIGNLFIGTTTEDDYFIGHIRYTGLLGNAPKYLPKTDSWTWNNVTEIFDYELDKDGYIKVLKETIVRESGSYSTIYKYFYEDVK